MKTIQGILLSKLLTVLGLFFPLVLNIGCNKLSNTYGVGQDKKRLKLSDSHVLKQKQENKDLIISVFNITSFSKNNNPLFFNDSQGRNLIHDTALYNKINWLKIYLITKGLTCYDNIQFDGTKDPNGYNAALNKKDKEGYTPLQLAVKNGHTEIVKLLIEDKRVDINIHNENVGTALNYAAWSGRVKVVELLINHGANVNKKNKFGYTSLHYAALSGCLEVVKELINHVDNINEKSKFGYTPLHLAANRNSLEVVKWFIDHGANVNEKSNDAGYTPLHLAALSGCLEVVKELINHGASVNEKNMFGYTPLHAAAARPTVTDYLKVVKVLVEHPDIQINAKNNSGETAFDLAKDQRIIDLLSVKFDKGNW